jgi:hypothetical protein
MIEQVSDVVAAKCKSLKHALRMCIGTSEIPLKQVAFDLEIDEKHLSRMLSDNPDDNRHFPPDKINDLMKVCGNLIPLRYLAYSHGFGIVRLKSEVELENERLKEELRKRDEKIQTIEDFMRKVKGI